LIEKFLNRYGTKHQNRRISTNPNGLLLAESQMFKHMCQRNGFDFEAKENTTLEKTMDDIIVNLPPQRRIIRTDGGDRIYRTSVQTDTGVHCHVDTLLGIYTYTTTRVTIISRLRAFNQSILLTQETEH
jgi:hypothetical protein